MNNELNWLLSFIAYRNIDYLNIKTWISISKLCLDFNSRCILYNLSSWQIWKLNSIFPHGLQFRHSLQSKTGGSRIIVLQKLGNGKQRALYLYTRLFLYISKAHVCLYYKTSWHANGFYCFHKRNDHFNFRSKKSFFRY